MGYYLIDNPPRSPQFYSSRNNAPTWAVSIHTSEGPGGPGNAWALAQFIAGRSDPGSYAVVVDSENTVELVPPEFTTFSVAASGYNSRTYAVCITGRSADLSPGDPYSLACIDRLGAVIAGLWLSRGVDLASSLAWIGTDALNRPGLFCHGDVQPWDRSDAWSRHSDRGALDALLIDAIRHHSNPAPPPPSPTQELTMRRFIRPDNSPQVYLADAGLLWKRPVTSEQDLKDTNWALVQSGVPILPPPVGAGVDTIAGIAVWVVSPSFADSIPTAG